MRAVALGLALVVADLLAGPAFAQPSPEEARRLAGEHFRKGQAAQKAGKFRDAIAEYEQAHELVPHPNTLFNIAVCYEKLGEWSLSADYYERYLEEPGDHRDAATVKAKIAELRAKVPPPPTTPVEPPTTTEPPPAATEPPSGGTIEGGLEPPPFVEPRPPRPRWHVGFSYGIGFGDAPTERYLGFAGMQIAERFEIDAILGKFGKNDLAIGVQGKLLLEKLGPVGPFGRGALTIGYAFQDNSPGAENRFPVGLEAGGGVLFGARGRFELAAVVRWTRGGFDMESTAVDSYVNDTFAIAIDLGIAFDLPKLGRTVVRTTGQ